MLAYFLKVNVAIALFYAFYRLFFYKDTFFGWRRAALLCFFALSATYPLLNIQSWITEQEPMVAMVDLYANVVLPEFTVQAATTDWKSLILDYSGMAYWGAVLLLSIRFLIQLAAIIRQAIRSRKTQIGNTAVHLLSQPGGPFSFFHWIFVHSSSHTEEELNEILTHEQTHARQWHSIDVLVSEIFCILCWFNPFAWLMKREIRTNLEYMADNRVLETGYDSKTYQFHLLGLSHHKAAATIYNSFNVLPLKKRIKMMNKKRTREIGRTKYLIFLPLAALLLLISNIEAVARTTKEITKEMLEVVNGNMTTETPKAEDATSMQIDAQAPQQEKLVTYQGKIVDNDGNPVAGIILGANNDYEIATDQSTTNKEGEFSFQAPVDAKIVAIYQKDGKYTTKHFTSADLKENGARIVMNEKWQEFIKNDDVQGDPVFEVVEHMPQFAEGGIEGLMNYLSKNIQYPANAKKNGVQGRITVQFIVNVDGGITNVKLFNKIDPELDAEAIRVISNMPKWKPGTQKGKAVRVRYTVPIMFKLGENKTNKNNQIASSKIDETVVVAAYTPTEVEASSGEKIYEVAEEMPSFVGGMPGLMKYLSSNIKYPVEAQKAKAQGRATVQVIINKEGNVTAPSIIRTSGNALLDAEAIRVVSAMPKWSPGTQRGKPVSVKYTMPIMFKLQ